eukprot:762435-Hanusia_phi.AAC.3
MRCITGGMTGAHELAGDHVHALKTADGKLYSRLKLNDLADPIKMVSLSRISEASHLLAGARGEPRSGELREDLGRHARGIARGPRSERARCCHRVSVLFPAVGEDSLSRCEGRKRRGEC